MPKLDECKPEHFSSNEKPLFPLQMAGEVQVIGWDIPWHWAIDANGQPYADYGAHGCSMTHTTYEVLLSELESSRQLNEVNAIRKLTGIKPKMALWMERALKHGWTPPPSFKREDYE